MTIQEYFESQKWTFAKTYAMFAPHEYLLRGKVADQEMYDKAVDYIQKHGITMWYYKNKRKYLFVGGWFYWIMEGYDWRGDEEHHAGLINRCKPEDYDIVFMKRGTQAKKYGLDCQQMKLELK